MIREQAQTQRPVVENVASIADDGFKTESIKRERTNPLSELIDDATYELLASQGLLYEKAIRDYQIRRRYREMRKDMASSDAIERLREAHPYLQYDTIRKIIYAKAS
jgi:hypothetical protein